MGQHEDWACAAGWASAQLGPDAPARTVFEIHLPLDAKMAASSRLVKERLLGCLAGMEVPGRGWDLEMRATHLARTSHH